MNRYNKPWPHSPGVIAQVDTHHGLGLHYATTQFEARIFNASARFPTYNEAVIWIEEQKDLRAEAELEANISEAGMRPPFAGCSCNLCTRKLSSSIADEMSA